VAHRYVQSIDPGRFGGEGTHVEVSANRRVKEGPKRRGTPVVNHRRGRQVGTEGWIGSVGKNDRREKKKSFA